MNVFYVIKNIWKEIDFVSTWICTFPAHICALFVGLSTNPLIHWGKGATLCIHRVNQDFNEYISNKSIWFQIHEGITWNVTKQIQMNRFNVLTAIKHIQRDVTCWVIVAPYIWINAEKRLPLKNVPKFIVKSVIRNSKTLIISGNTWWWVISNLRVTVWTIKSNFFSTGT